MVSAVRSPGPRLDADVRTTPLQVMFVLPSLESRGCLNLHRAPGRRSHARRESWAIRESWV